MPIFMINYFKDVRSEMKHVSWPSRRLTITYTIVVIAISLATAVYLGLWDYVLSALIKQVI
jgi:preprotein translocase subunit SecE